MEDQKVSWSSFNLFKIIGVKCHARFWIAWVEFQLVSLSNYGSISYRLGVIGDRRPLHQGHSRSKMKMPFDKIRPRGHFYQQAPTGYEQPFSLYGWSKVVMIFIWALQGHQGQRSCRIENPGVEFLLVSLSDYGSISHLLSAMTAESSRDRQSDRHDTH